MSNPTDPPEATPHASSWSGKPLSAGLYLVATPIGNLGDITLRALDVLRRAAVIAAEDTRVTAALLRAHGVRTPLVAYHDHSSDAVVDRLVTQARAAAVALVSDAGTPLLSDPGYPLVRAAREAGVPVTVVPGACAAIAALTLSGLPADRFLFAGFLPARAGARRAAIAGYAAVPATLVFYESPHRVAASLADLAQGLGGQRPAVLARELTKLFEQVRSGTLAELAAEAVRDPPRGEVVLVIGPAEETVSVTDDAALDAALATAMAAGSLKDAAASVAEALGLPRKQVYARALALARAPAAAVAPSS